MNGSCFIISARRGIIWIGKYAPFLIVFIVTLSNVETLYSVTTDRYAMFDGMIIYYKPISWWIGKRFEINIAWVIALLVLSIGVEACLWNRLSIAYLTSVIYQKDFFTEHQISETLFIVVLIINSVIGVYFTYKGIRIITNKRS